MTYSKEFKEQALKLSDEIGPKQAALQLGISYGTLGDWRKTCNRSKIEGKKNESKAEPPLTDREKRLLKENAELKEANDILKEAFRFFVNDRKY